MKIYLKNLFFLLLTLLLIACEKESIKPPVVITLNISEITATTALAGGKLNEVSSFIASKGICWSTEQNPTTENSRTLDFSKNTNFECSLTGLFPDTKYYVKAFAINPAGTAYGNQIEFKTLKLNSGN